MKNYDSYIEMSKFSDEADELVTLIWDGLMKAIDDGRTSFTEAEVQFYLHYSKSRLRAEDAQFSPNFQAK